MSERMTTITLPGGTGVGFQDWGRKTPAEMIATIRRHAEHQKLCAEEILRASDADFRVETHLGMHLWRRVEVLQEGRR